MCNAEIYDQFTNTKAPPASVTIGGKNKQPSPLIAEHDAEGRPVGIGGASRNRSVMDVVDGMQSGLEIPRR